MRRRRTPVITAADDGSKFVGEFYRDRGRPPTRRRQRGSPRRNLSRDGLAFALHLAYRVCGQPVKWVEIARLCGYDSDDFDAPERLQRASNRLMGIKVGKMLGITTRHGPALHDD